MSDVQDQQAVEAKKRRSFRKFSYRGIDLKDLAGISIEDFSKVVHARARRKLARGLNTKPMGLMRKLRKAKEAAGPNEKPAVVKTHLRNMIVVPEMIGSVIGVYNGKVFNQVEVKPEMVGHYLGEFSISYRPVAHKRPGVSGSGSKFMPLR
uniref:ARAD1D34540p n=1 Tax=Blastobotrys adeninivorans TaxID=409370 RepID=A0A060THW2_BLAAD